jgi:hypothetical protein
MGIKKSRYRAKISWDFAPLPLLTDALLQGEVQQKSSDLSAFCGLSRHFGEIHSRPGRKRPLSRTSRSC